MKYRIYLSPPSHGKDEVIAVTEAIESGWLSSQGASVQEFTNSLQQFLKRPTLLTNSGTSAIHLALIVAGVKENDLVLCSNFTFAASAFPILYQKAVPVFIGVEEQSWNLSPDFLTQAINELPQTPKALVVTDVYGMPADFDEIIKICEKHNITIIEDAAEALGSYYKGKQAGTLANLGVLSFNGNKIVTTSAGGALIAKEKQNIETAKIIASQAKESQDFYEHKRVGYNMLQSNILAAIGNVQFQNLEERVEKRRKIFEYYKIGLEAHFKIQFQEEENRTSNRWLSSFVFEPRYAAKFKNQLQKNGIESRYLFAPLHEQDVFKNSLYFGDELEKNLFKNGLSLPSGFDLKTEDQDEIMNILKNSL